MSSYWFDGYGVDYTVCIFWQDSTVHSFRFQMSILSLGYSQSGDLYVLPMIVWVSSKVSSIIFVPFTYQMLARKLGSEYKVRHDISPIEQR